MPIDKSSCRHLINKNWGGTPSLATSLHISLLDAPRRLLVPLSAQARPLSAKPDGKPPALSPISDGLRAKMIKADVMSRHEPLSRWTPLRQVHLQRETAQDKCRAE